MGGIEEMWRRQFEDCSLQRVLLSKALYLRMCNLGFKLQDSFIDELESALVKMKDGQFSVSIPDESLPVGVSRSDLAKDLGKLLGDLKNELESVIDGFRLGIAETIPEFTQDLATELYKDITRSAKLVLREERSGSLKFERNLMKHWQDAFDALETLIGSCREVGSEFNKEWRSLDDRNEQFALV